MMTSPDPALPPPFSMVTFFADVSTKEEPPPPPPPDPASPVTGRGTAAVGPTAAATATVVTATTAAAGTTSEQVTVSVTCAVSADGERSVCPFTPGTTTSVLFVSAFAADSAFSLFAAATTAAAADSGVEAGDETTFPGMPVYPGKTAATATGTTVMLTFSAGSARAARDEHAIFY